MSISNSISTTDSTSSSNAMPTTQSNEQPIDPSNLLYNDHQNYQIIFTNDSRFFDTSLHLFQSYRKLGYIQTDNKKLKKTFFSTSTNTLKPQVNGQKHRSRSKPTGFRSNHNLDGNNNGTLKPPFSREHDRSASQRSDPTSLKLISSKIKRDNSHLIVSQQRQWTPANHSANNDDSSDDPDIIVTRL